MKSLGDGGMNVPYEDNPEPVLAEDLGLTHSHISAGVVTMAATVDVAGERQPAILFRFGDGNGDFYPPMLLVLSDEEMAALPDVIGDAARAALSAAAKGL